MEQLENNEDVEYLFDTFGSKLVSPLLGSKIGAMATKQVNKIWEMQLKKRAPFIKQRDQKKAERLELKEKLANLYILTPEDEAQFQRDSKDLRELEEYIAIAEAYKESNSLGSFRPNQIKGKLINEFSAFVGNIASHKKSADAPISKWEAKAMLQRREWNEAARQREETERRVKETDTFLEQAKATRSELKARTDQYAFNSFNKVDTEDKIRQLQDEITGLRKQIQTNKDATKAKTARTKGILDVIARKANQLDVAVRGILSGTKVDLRDVKGLDQGNVLTVDALKDIKEINWLITEIIHTSAEGSELIELFSDEEEVLDDVYKEQGSLKSRTKALDREISLGRGTLDEEEEDVRFRREYHRKEIEAIKAENEELMKNGKEQKEMPGFVPEPNEYMQALLTETKEKIKFLESELERTKSVQQDTVQKQKAVEAKLEKIWEQIYSNKTEYSELLGKVNEIRGYYPGNEITQIKAGTPYNPFAVQVDTQGLDLIEPPTR